MQFRFIGQYTNGHTSITMYGTTFEGNEPADVSDSEAVRRLSGSPEFEAIDALDHDADGKKGGSKKQSADDDLSDLRSEYAKKFGKKPFNGWNADTLREKLEA
jgi:hypothetical protein